MSEGLAPVLVRALQDVFGLPSELLQPGARLEDDLQLDSLSLVELAVVIEDETGVRMPSNDPHAPATLADLQCALDAALSRSEPGEPGAPAPTALSSLSDPAA